VVWAKLDVAFHSLGSERVKGKGRLSVHFPELREAYSRAAENIMSYDLGLSAEKDTETLREWAESIEKDRNLLKSFIKDYRPKG